jgi:putative tryptophan/tyrosine transport system substrate-binding protein
METPAVLAVKQATISVPIVIASVGDPMASGIVTSLAHPGENITGSSWFGPEIESKRVELLKEAIPRLSQVAALINPDNRVTQLDLEAMETAAHAINVALQRFPVRTPSEFEEAFARMEQGHVDAVVIQTEGMLLANTGAIATLAMKRRLPAIGDKSFAQAGGRWAMELILSRSSAGQRHSWTRFSRAQSPPIFQSSEQQNSTLRAISKRRRRWASICLRRSCCEPTR